MKRRLLSFFTSICIISSFFVSVTHVHAENWILASQLPACTEITGRKWTYTLTSYTTSSSSSLSGWTKYDTTWVWGPWGSWSSWSDTKRTASDSRDVQTRKVDDTSKVDKYHYYRYAASKNASTGSKTKTSVCTNKYTYAISNELSSNGSGGYKLYHDSSGNYDPNGSKYHSVWKDDPFKTYKTKTQYRYRDRSKVYTYYYKKVENKESSTYPSGSNISNIQEWVTYKYKSFTLDLNGMLDGAYAGWLNGYGTADIYINGSLVADDVSDYCTTHTCGTTYEIKDIKSAIGHTYDGVYSGNLSGTITDNTSVLLSYHTNSYSVTVTSDDSNKGSVSGSSTYTYGTNVEIKALPKPGYTFSHWNDGSVDNPKTITVTAPSNYIAYFDANTYVVSFDANGGSVDLLNKTVIFNNSYGELPTPIRERYRFDGWFTSQTGGEKINSDSNVSITNDHTLYAQWSESEHIYTDWIIDAFPTCTNDGEQHRKCVDCGSVERVVLPPTGHSYAKEWVIKKEPTCITEGKKVHQCSLCGVEVDITEIEKAPHSYGDWVITKELEMSRYV